MAGKIFISYRRSGNPKDALLVYKHLSAEFGPAAVFMDVNGIRPGDDFVEVLEQQLADCTVLLALIGPDWLHAKNEHGGRKLDDEDDFVRVEIRTALQRKMRVVPLLLDGAPMPRRIDLPEDLHPMVRRQGLPVDATNLHNFRAAMGRLEEVLHEALSAEPTFGSADEVAASPESATSSLHELLEQLKKSGTMGGPRPEIYVPGGAERWMFAEGLDSYGHWAEIAIRGVVQRLRWIEPGEFWMGSTEAERKRFAVQGDDDWKKLIQNEAPRHRVKLTRGFWLADTACTQALWQTVAGDNPSHFTGDPNLPVEMVSWDDVTQKFLPALNRQLSEVTAVLPTEAQWEYACRAGTETAYHFGEQIHTDQVNYDGSHPPPGGRKGEYRQRTVPVKALPANGWGLFQMHGNVLEWCADAWRSYSKDAAIDPDGGQDGVGRVLRSCSWANEAEYARSAVRSSAHRDFRDESVGFRFALMSI